MYRRSYVPVGAVFDSQGKITPLHIELNGQRYEIDQVLDVRQAPATKAGGLGMRYTVRIGAHQTYLFLDDEQRWFVEEKIKGIVPRQGDTSRQPR